MKSILVIVLLLATLALPVHAEDEACDMLFVQDAELWPVIIKRPNQLTRSVR